MKLFKRLFRIAQEHFLLTAQAINTLIARYCIWKYVKHYYSFICKQHVWLGADAKFSNVYMSPLQYLHVFKKPNQTYKKIEQ